MNTTRTIEITAKSEEEAKELVQRELQDNETIISSDTISAPAKGIFGYVGNPEYKIRFSIGIKEEEPEESISVEQEPQEEIIARRNNDRDEDEAPVREKRQRRNYDRNERRMEIETPDRPKEEVSEKIKSHPKYNEIFELVTEVANNVGIEELDLTDFARDGAWVIEASGENVSQLIGKRGRTLDSLQYLMNIILNKGKDERIKLVLDVQGYREKRYKNLILLANRMFKKAISSRKQIELEPMSTLDRRTVHLALKDKTGIETFSKGVEPMRRVVITPMKKKRNHVNSGWQPATTAVSEVNDEPVTEAPTAVPMFMEEDV